MRTFLIVLAALVVGFAPAPLPKRDRASGDRNRLDGVWLVEATKFRGNPVLSIHYGNGLTFRLQDRVRITRGELTFPDDAPSQPARWSIRFHRGTNDFDFLPLPDGPHRLLGFDRLEEDHGTLTLAFRSASSGRPQAFSDEHVAFVVLTRGKP
jgi:hypothetical protein